jgi:hypothetical protein
MTLHLALSLAAALAGSDRPSLRGTVTAADGEPLANALVIIYTAKPRVGTSATCPSCYTDCAKSATTNERGELEIRSLDPSLLFRVGGLAADSEARFVADVDPAAGPITIASARPLSGVSESMLDEK